MKINCSISCNYRDHLDLVVDLEEKEIQVLMEIRESMELKGQLVTEDVVEMMEFLDPPDLQDHQDHQVYLEA